MIDIGELQTDRDWQGISLKNVTDGWNDIQTELKTEIYRQYQIQRVPDWERDKNIYLHT